MNSQEYDILEERLSEQHIFDKDDSDDFKEKVLNNVMEFCIRMALKAETFMDKYESYEMRNKAQIRSMKDLDKLFIYIRRDLQEQSDKKMSNTVQNNITK